MDSQRKKGRVSEIGGGGTKVKKQHEQEDVEERI